MRGFRTSPWFFVSVRTGPRFPFALTVRASMFASDFGPGSDCTQAVRNEPSGSTATEGGSPKVNGAAGEVSANGFDQSAAAGAAAIARTATVTSPTSARPTALAVRGCDPADSLDPSSRFLSCMGRPFPADAARLFRAATVTGEQPTPFGTLIGKAGVRLDPISL